MKLKQARRESNGAGIVWTQQSVHAVIENPCRAGSCSAGLHADASGTLYDHLHLPTLTHQAAVISEQVSALRNAAGRLISANCDFIASLLASVFLLCLLNSDVEKKIMELSGMFTPCPTTLLPRRRGSHLDLQELLQAVQVACPQGAERRHLDIPGQAPHLQQRRPEVPPRLHRRAPHPCPHPRVLLAAHPLRPPAEHL